jgi:hypothetical protein
MYYQKLLSKARQLKRYATIKYATRQLLWRRNHHLAQPSQLVGKSVAEYLTVMMSYKITNQERLRILSAVLQQVKQALVGSGIMLHVIDASEREYLQYTEPMFRESELPVSFTSASKRLCQAYIEMLHQIPQKYVYLQFDDFITVGLTPEFLYAACHLLEKYAGLVDVVCIMWPFEVKISEAERTINVIGFQKAVNLLDSQETYLFGYGTPQIPIFIEKIGAYEFGIFENFQYGFFFNHLIAPAQDYLRRLDWYIRHISSTSVHAIEVAASERTIGPFWTHLAICLSDVCLLDVDYSHTNEALRPESEQNRVVVEALRRRYALKASHRNTLNQAISAQ